MKRLLVVILLPLVLEACGRSSATPRTAEPPVAVRVAAVTVEKMALPVTATGTLGLKEEVPLSFKVGGVVARILVDEGQGVRAGEALAALDLGEIDPGVARARSAADKAERDLARARRLYADSVATLEQVQDAETARDVAQAELQSVAFNRRHAVIVAPASGVILRRRAEPGELVRAGDPILILGSHARGQVVRVGLADRDAVRVRRGDEARVRFDALPGQSWAGRVTEVAAAADPATGTYQIEVSVPGTIALASGLVGTVEIRPAAGSPVALVPVESVLEADGTRGTVFTLGADGRAERRQVTLAFLAGDRIAVAAGLEGVRRVVTDGAAYLDDGDRVEVRP
jgi:RND family efflux transporter MFP subunit